MPPKYPEVPEHHLLSSEQFGTVKSSLEQFREVWNSQSYMCDGMGWMDGLLSLNELLIRVTAERC